MDRDAAKTASRNLRRNRNRRFQACLAKVHAEPGAPNRDVLVFAEVGVFRDLVVLIAAITFHRPKIDEAGLLDGVVACVDFTSGQVDVGRRARWTFQIRLDAMCVCRPAVDKSMPVLWFRAPAP